MSFVLTESLLHGTFPLLLVILYGSICTLFFEVEVKLALILLNSTSLQLHLGSFESLLHNAFRSYSCIFGTFGLFKELFGQHVLFDLLVIGNFKMGFLLDLSTLDIWMRNCLSLWVSLVNVLQGSWRPMGWPSMVIIYVRCTIYIQDQGLALRLLTHST